MSTRPSFVAALLAATVLPAHALVAGDLMFSAFNADEDGWSVVALVELAPHTTVFFSDNEWDGAGGFNGGESYHRWTSGASAIAAGTVVRFSSTDSATLLAASVGTLERASVAGSTNFGLSQTAETLYAYQGTAATLPSVFLTAVSTGAFSALEGSLAGTGLVAGLGATQLGAGSDYAEFAGPRSGLTAAQFRQRLAETADWSDLGDGTFASNVPNLQAFAVTAVPEPTGVALALAGLGVLGALRTARLQVRRRSSTAVPLFVPVMVSLTGCSMVAHPQFHEESTC